MQYNDDRNTWVRYKERDNMITTDLISVSSALENPVISTKNSMVWSVQWHELLGEDGYAIIRTTTCVANKNNKK